MRQLALSHRSCHSLLSIADYRLTQPLQQRIRGHQPYYSCTRTAVLGLVVEELYTYRTTTVCSPIFTALWHRGARILRNFDLLTLARARTGHNMSPATAPCARAPGGAMSAPGSRAIFTVLAISAMRGPQNGWLGASHFSEFMHAFRAACMHSGLPACM
eukprot:COSAG05_NODE_1254_length_5375_cov_10.078658_6_plen_159_part_00